MLKGVLRPTKIVLNLSFIHATNDIQKTAMQNSKPTGTAYDLNTAPDEVILDIWDMTATFSVNKASIWRKVQQGIIPPPFEHVGRGHRAHWNIGQIRKWRKARAIALTESAEQKMIENCKLVKSLSTKSEYSFL